jgi:hypothetical protein
MRCILRANEKLIADNFPFAATQRSGNWRHQGKT